MNRPVNRRVAQERKPANRRIKKSGTASSGNVAGNLPSQKSLLISWLLHHRFSCLDSLARLIRSPWQSVMTWLVVAIALVLPGVLYLGLQNVQQIGEGWQDKPKMSIYIDYQAKPLAIEQLSDRLLALPAIDSLTLVTPEQAKQEFQTYSGLGDILASLENNPLPALLLATPAANASSPDQLSELQKVVEQEALVDFVQLDVTWLRRLHEMMNLAEHIVTALAALLGLGVLLIIGNTIRLAIENRREEIVVVKMVGGSDGFVRCPFLYTGFWYGIGGGLLASVVLVGAGLWLQAPVLRLVSLYDSNYSLLWLSPINGLILIVGAGLLGWLGAWLAVSRHLRHIQPE